MKSSFSDSEMPAWRKELVKLIKAQASVKDSRWEQEYFEEFSEVGLNNLGADTSLNGLKEFAKLGDS